MKNKFYLHNMIEFYSFHDFNHIWQILEKAEFLKSPLLFQDNTIISFVGHRKMCMELDQQRGIVISKTCSRSNLQKWEWERRTLSLH